MRSSRERKLITKHWLYGGSGAMLLGSGLATLLHGSRLSEIGDGRWFWISTGGFALIMSGLSFIGDANRFKTLADVLRELDSRGIKSAD